MQQIDTENYKRFSLVHHDNLGINTPFFFPFSHFSLLCRNLYASSKIKWKNQHRARDDGRTRFSDYTTKSFAGRRPSAAAVGRSSQDGSVLIVDAHARHVNELSARTKNAPDVDPILSTTMAMMIDGRDVHCSTINLLPFCFGI